MAAKSRTWLNSRHTNLRYTEPIRPTLTSSSPPQPPLQLRALIHSNCSVNTADLEHKTTKTTTRSTPSAPQMPPDAHCTCPTHLRTPWLASAPNLVLLPNPPYQAQHTSASKKQGGLTARRTRPQCPLPTRCIHSLGTCKQPQASNKGSAADELRAPRVKTRGRTSYLRYTTR